MTAHGPRADLLQPATLDPEVDIPAARKQSFKAPRPPSEVTSAVTSAIQPAEYFTGTVRIDPLFQAPAPARSSGAYVTFEPCARSNWHTHPLGQTLIVTSGCGYVQSWGGPIKVIRPGDVIFSCPPGEKHWHGAAPGTAMTHIAIQEELNGKVVDWMEKVTDEQYNGAREE